MIQLILLHTFFTLITLSINMKEFWVLSFISFAYTAYEIDCFQVKWAGVRTQNSTTPFIDDMYDQLQEMLNEYEIIIYHWPKYAVVLENVCSIIFLPFLTKVYPIILIVIILVLLKF